ncbi:MAG: AMP-binding protein [Kiloniellales bacterium]
MTPAANDIVDLFLARAAGQPERLAVVQSGRSVSYGELEAGVRRLAAALAETSAASGEPPRVLVHLPSGAAAYTAMLATAMAGGYYAPNNLSAPLERQRMVAQRFAPNVVVTSAELASGIRDSAGDACFLDPADLAAPPLAAPLPPHDLLYVMFTSGSTGVPKGVTVPRDAVSHYTAWVLDTTRVTPEDRWSQHPNLAFDISGTDIYGALCGGASIYPLVSQADRLMPFRFLRTHGLTIWNSVPSVVDSMTKLNLVKPETLASLRLMIFCGEALLPAHLEALFAARLDLPVCNTYGPTEATIACSHVTLHKDDYQAASRFNVSIGVPMPGVGLHLVGGAHGDEGEIAITGPQLARGYWQDPETTAGVFRSITLEGREVPAYFTGDWAERIDGRIYFQHRIDHQVKIRGYRLELGEVNAAIRKAGLPAAHTALVGDELHAFLLADEAAVDLGALHGTLKTLLSDYALPRHYHFVEDFPRNANDKVDLRALAESLRKTPAK